MEVAIHEPIQPPITPIAPQAALVEQLLKRLSLKILIRTAKHTDREAMEQP